MDPSGQAAWIQGIGTILAIGVAIWIPYRQTLHERRSKLASDRKIVMSAAANLEIALAYESAVLDFAPAGDGQISHTFTLQQAREFMKLQPQAREALEKAVEKAHYFDEDLCGEIVRLGIEAAAYDRIIDDVARRAPSADPDEFFRSTKGAKDKLSERLDKVRRLLVAYLPQR